LSKIEIEAFSAFFIEKLLPDLGYQISPPDLTIFFFHPLPYLSPSVLELELDLISLSMTMTPKKEPSPIMKPPSLHPCFLNRPPQLPHRVLLRIPFPVSRHRLKIHPVSIYQSP
jgi:hypothetical protein